MLATAWVSSQPLPWYAPHPRTANNAGDMCQKLWLDVIDSHYALQVNACSGFALHVTAVTAGNAEYAVK